MSSESAEKVKEGVKAYYGKKLKTSDDLQTNACKLGDKQMTPAVKSALKLIHDEVASKFYGCGLVAPEALDGMKILDLGSGSGQDCFVLSKLVGEHGHVTGVDMTKEQVDVANKYVEYHAEQFGYSKPNTDFKLGEMEHLSDVDVANKYVEYHAEQFGYSKPNTDFKLGEMEHLSDVGIQDSSLDIIISNCVVNLTADKSVVLKEAYRVLKDGGEMYFSDVYTDTKLSEEARKDEVLWGECVSGALHWKELVELSKEVGFSGPHLVTARPFVVGEHLREPLGDAQFVSATYRLFKVPESCKTDASRVTYKGSIEENPEEFKFNVYNILTKTPKLVSSDVASVLSASRFSKHFEFQPLEPGTTVPVDDVYIQADPFAYCASNKVAPGACCPKPAKPVEQENGCSPKRAKTDNGARCC
ncbi:Arsenite methyltransferase [Stylophora pistillata]|uniref:Arsenite methyltransferase n=1 Tax=Stylophora pistillata TaxID=50429 RepID=A0A2B4SB75_STYPI|nr:Arsenite methyltransferase [Stylophora pistillata]